MKRVLLIAASLGILLPGMALAQVKPEEGGKSHDAAAPHGGSGAPQAHAQIMRPQTVGRPVAQSRPLPPRGDQFWHRGQYYSRGHAPAYVYPQGWRYRQWNIGMRLPALLCGPGYYYADWAALGLQAPPPDYAWVRFGPDLLLVNLITYEVEDVIYGALL